MLICHQDIFFDVAAVYIFAFFKSTGLSVLLIVAFWVFFTYSGYKACVMYVTCEYILSLVIFFTLSPQISAVLFIIPLAQTVCNSLSLIIWHGIKIITLKEIQTLWEENICDPNDKKPKRRAGRQREEQGKCLLVARSEISSGGRAGHHSWSSVREAGGVRRSSRDRD